MASPAPTSSAVPSTAARVACPLCRVLLTVRTELAGRRIKCKCGHAFEAPAAHEITIAAERQAAAEAMKRGYAPARKQIINEDAHPPQKENPLLDFVLPVILLPAGVALCLVQAVYFDKHEHRLIEVIGPTIVGIITSLALMIGAVLVAALTMGMVFPTKPWQTGLKIAGIALVPCAAGEIIKGMIGGYNGEILGVLSAVALYVLLVKVILRQSWEHTGVIVFLCWTVRAFTMYMMYKLAGARGHGWL